MMTADENGEVSEEISLADLLGLEKTELDASVNFWRGKGMVGFNRSGKSGKAATPAKKESAKASEIPSAHKNGALESRGAAYSYTSSELADILEKREELSTFIEEAQNVAGKMFTHNDTGIVVRLVQEDGFEEEAVLHIISYCVRQGRKSLGSIEKFALGYFLDAGITTSDGVAAKIALLERSSETVYKIKQLFGIGERELSKTEKGFFDKWTQKFGYDVDVIRMAYDITIDSIQKPSPNYAGKILEKWYDEGLRTASEIAEFEAEKKQAKINEGNSDKSYDLDDFFEAALQRSLEELK